MVGGSNPLVPTIFKGLTVSTVGPYFLKSPVSHHKDCIFDSLGKVGFSLSRERVLKASSLIRIGGTNGGEIHLQLPLFAGERPFFGP